MCNERNENDLLKLYCLRIFPKVERRGLKWISIFTFTYTSLEYLPLPPNTSTKPYIEVGKVSKVFFFFRTHPRSPTRYLCRRFIKARLLQKVCMIFLSACGVNGGHVTQSVSRSAIFTTADFQNLFWQHKSTCLVKIWWLSRKYGTPLLVTLFNKKCKPIIVNPVVKMRPHLAAHPQPITRKCPRNIL